MNKKLNVMNIKIIFTAFMSWYKLWNNAIFNLVYGSINKMEIQTYKNEHNET